MGQANFAGWNFRIDPSTVHWDFKVRTNTKYTLGGKVVQVLGTEFGNITAQGEFGRGYYQEQQEFLDHMIEVGNSQVTNFADSEPPRFIYPDYGWDFLCYLVSYTSDKGPAAVYDIETVSPQWKLELHIVEDNTGLSEATTENFIKRLAEGIGWEINEHNGPAEWESVRDFLNKVNANDLPDLYQMAYGAGNGEGGGDYNYGGTTNDPNDDKLTPNTRAAKAFILDNWPEIESIGGWRADGGGYPDHPGGWALDVMITLDGSAAERDKRELGDEIARYFLENPNSFSTKYVIWFQRIQSGPGGWRDMDDRGSDNANHKNHVHISFNEDGELGPEGGSWL